MEAEREDKDQLRQGSELTCDFHVEQLIDLKDPVFAGHYSHFPIYPGTLLVERMRLAVQQHAAASGIKLVLTKIQRINFHHPVFPGAKISLKCTTVSWVGATLRLNLEVVTNRPIATAKMDFEAVNVYSS